MAYYAEHHKQIPIHAQAWRGAKAVRSGCECELPYLAVREQWRRRLHIPMRAGVFAAKVVCHYNSQYIWRMPDVEENEAEYRFRLLQFMATMHMSPAATAAERMKMNKQRMCLCM